MEIDHICANPPCKCRVEKIGDYCSKACRRHHNDQELTHCECGHVDCGTSTPEARGEPDQNQDN